MIPLFSKLAVMVVGGFVIGRVARLFVDMWETK